MPVDSRFGRRGGWLGATPGAAYQSGSGI